MSEVGRSRSRSASPPRSERQPKKLKTSGFKWKEKKPRDEVNNDDYYSNRNRDERDSGRLERGYRDRSPRRRARSPPDRPRDRDRAREGDRYGERPPRSERDKPRESERDSAPVSATAVSAETNDPLTEKKPKKQKTKTAASRPSEPMIIVNVNDRLGTKAAIPCLASDSVKAFKAIVAAHIGRQPHEILLKRQGERPFKDQLTLEDYGVSSGVQLDLELDTGD